MAQADLQFLQTLQAYRVPFLNEFFLLITRFGEELIILPFICLIYWCFHKRLAIYLGLSFFFATTVNQLLKVTFCIPRPWLRDAAVQPVPEAFASATGYSFPSGHTAGAVSIYGGLAIWFKRQKWLQWLMILLVALVAFSRVYLGVHTPSDVLVSLVVGLMILRINALIFAMLDSHPDQDWRVVGGFLCLLAAAMIFVLSKAYPADATDDLKADSMKTFGAAAGALCAWLWERRKIRFIEPKLPFQKALVFFVGIAVTLGIKAGLKAPLISMLGILGGNFIRYFLMCFWVIGAYPFLFSKVVKSAPQPANG